MRILRVDAQGNPWATGALLVADRQFSSTQDYGLGIDSLGNALLTFRDDRSGSVEISAAKVTTAGTLAWSPTGVALTSGAGFVAQPAICGTADGGAVVAWTENSSTKVQKLDANGLPVWATPVDFTPASGFYFCSDVQSNGVGAIVSIVHQTGGFSSPRHLVAQSLDGSGSALWGSSLLAIFDGGSLQFGNFPDFVSDGAGGAVFAWYSSSPNLQSFAQRVDATGNELWPHNGVAVANTPGQIRTNAHVAFDAQSGDTYVACTESNAGQSMSGITAQRIDAGGNLGWGAGGVTVAALGAASHGLARISPGGSSGGALVLWSEAPSFQTDQLFGLHVDLSGSVDVPRFNVASTPSGKSRMAVATSNTGYIAAAWGDTRNDGGDIYGQGVRFDGTLGGSPFLGSMYCANALNSTGFSGKLQATGSDVAADNNLTLRVSDLPPGQFGFFLCSETQGFTANPGGSVGDLCLALSIGRYNQAGQIFQSTAGGTASLALDLTLTPTPTQPTAIVAGQTWNFQCWYRDNMPGVSQSNFTDARSILFR